MSDLADLFSGSSPPPRPRTPSPLPEEPLFLSPGDTPRPEPRNHAGGSRAGQHVERAEPTSNWDALNGTERDVPFVDPMAIDDQPTKKRRVVAKIDEERLLGPNGFPALMKAAKKFKVRGKNREAEDLRELLSTYQMWAHGMFPKGDFHSTISRVEVVCRKRRMESAMKGYRDAFYPPPRTPSPPGSPGLPGSSADLDADAAFDHSPLVNVPDLARNLPSSEPLYGPTDDDDGPDMDEIMAMEEMERQPKATPDDDWDIYD